MDMSLSELQELVMDRGSQHAAFLGVKKSRTQLSDWTEGTSQVALVVKNLPANKGEVRDAGSIPG